MTANVKASYVAGGGHMHLFLGYPYFGNKTLEHDPSIGVEYISAFVTPVRVLISAAAGGVIGLVIAVAKWRKKTVRIVRAT